MWRTVGEFTANGAGQGAAPVRTTGACDMSAAFALAAVSTLRKNSCADFGSLDSVPDATATLLEASAAYPLLALLDHRIPALCEASDELEPIERTHARVAWTLSEIPRIDSSRPVLPITGVAWS